MKRKEYKVLGHAVEYNVPESSDEFNKLDPKRPDAACEEATSNIVYRSMNPDTRYWFLHGRSAEETKKLIEAGTLPASATAIDGVEAEANSWDLDFGSGFEVRIGGVKQTVTNFDRATEVVKDKGGKPRTKDGEDVTKFVESEEAYYKRVLAMAVSLKKFASEDAARAHFDASIKLIASEVPFDITKPEGGERGPTKLAKKYKESAAIAITNGTIDRINTNQFAKIGVTFTATGDMTKVFKGSKEIVVKRDEQGNPVEKKTIEYEVSDKDAEALGWLIKRYRDWEDEQRQADIVG